MTSLKACVSCLFLPILLITDVAAFPAGAMERSCVDLKPIHGRNGTLQLPFAIRLRNNKVYGGETLDFIIINGTSQSFRGFLVKAVISGTNTYVGKMDENSAENVALRCDGSGLTHRDGKVPKFSKEMKWTAPSNPTEEALVQLQAVIVQDYEVNYYANSINFKVLPTTTPTPRAAPPPPRQPQTGDTAQMGVSGQLTNEPGRDSQPRERTPRDPIDTMSAQARRELTQEESKTSHDLKIQLDPGCGDTLGCFHDCEKGRCTFIVTWKDNGKYVSFHMKRIEPERSERWMAIGFSEDEYMGDDSVVEAVIDRGIVSVYSSYNTDKTNARLDDQTAGLKNAVGSYVNGILECSFDRVKSDEFYPQLKDLNKEVYLMFADGEAITGTLFPHDYTKLPRISPKVDLKSFANVGGDGPTFPLVRSHATGPGSDVMVSVGTWIAILAAGLH